MLNELRTYDSGEYDGEPTPTGRVYIMMKSMVTGKPHIYIKQSKTKDIWYELTPLDNDQDIRDECWAFSKQGAKKIIERYQAKTYKDNYDKGLITFQMLEEYNY